MSLCFDSWHASISISIPPWNTGSFDRQEEWMQAWNKWERMKKTRETKNLWKREKSEWAWGGGKKSKKWQRYGLCGRGEGGEARGGRLVHAAPPCRPCIHTYSHTVQAADINNFLLIFICSGKMWGQSNPDTNRLSTCLSLFALCLMFRISICLCNVHISHISWHFYPICCDWNSINRSYFTSRGHHESIVFAFWDRNSGKNKLTYSTC